jgi:BirA family transcriptional regulator, biotin operon repressor / biotin---[acetyl-CoA-carboxylase] ligase
LYETFSVVSIQAKMTSELLLPENILPYLSTRSFGRTIHHRDQVDSTNDLAHQLAMAGAFEGTLVLAEEQSSGRGRLGRTWTSERFSGIYASLILRPKIEPREAPLLNLVAAVAVSRGIRDVVELETDIKWPNDVMVNGHKCCGILTEMSADIDKVQFVIAGIGINVNQKNFPPELENKASSLFLEAKKEISRIEIVVSVLKRFEDLYGEFLRQGRSVVLEQWIQRSSYASGRKVIVESGNRRISGITVGLGEDGTLQVRTENGQIETVMSGDLVAWESTAHVTRY